MGHGPLGPLAFWEGYENELLTLAVYAVGLALYAVFVGSFYMTLSHRNLLGKARPRRPPSTLEFAVFFPLISFGLFLVLSVALFFLAKGRTVPEILLLSMAIVGAVRVCAYISERAAEDLAKTMPLGLLAVLLVDPGYLSLTIPFERMAQLPAQFDLVARFLLTLVVLEVVLRVGWILTGGSARARAREKEGAKPGRGWRRARAPEAEAPAAPAAQKPGAPP